ALSMVAGNVFIPRLSRVLGDLAAHGRVVQQLKRTYIGLAVVSGALVWGLGWLLMRYGYGPAFFELTSLWPWLALLIVVRVVAAKYGVQLTALGQQTVRSVVNMFSLTATVLLILCAATMDLGLSGVIGALVVSSMVVLLAYRYKLKSVEKFA
ncbi:MAG: hypothetical protein WCK08_18840, partial [Betaproteobacteria bacterium]